MTETLALKYRPVRFADIVGQRITAVVLDRMVASRSVPSGMLFSGPRGTGKTSTARILASQLDADLIEVDAASHGLVDDVRQMIEALRYGGARVIIYDEAHSMSKEAFNALLKTLEEPPAGTIFILVTTEPDKIPETVKSRLMEFSFRKLTGLQIEDRLMDIAEAEDIEISKELVRYLSDHADGALRDAIMMLDQCWKGNIQSLDEFLEMTGEANVAHTLVVAMLTGDHAHVFEVADDLSQRVPDPQRLASMLVGVLKDVLILKSGGVVDAKQDTLDTLKSIALNLETERIVASMKMLWDLRTRVRSSNDPRGNLDLALTLITEIFTKGRQPTPQASVKSESRKLTMAEL